MKSATLTLAALAALAAFVPALAQAKAAQDKAAPAKGQAGAAPAASKELYPKAYFDFLLKERLAQGQPDTPELRNAVRDELNTRELLVREAKKKGLDKNADVKNQMDLTAQTVLVRAYVGDWVKANPIPGRRAAQGIRHDQGADGRQGVQGPPHPGREGRRGEGHHRRAAEGRPSSRSSPSARRIRARRPTAATSTGTRRATS